MITTPTVFVLGAGASEPYTFPVGQRLAELIVETARPGHGLYNELQRLGIAEGHINTFRDQLLGSAQNSVDAFLAYRNDLMSIGKLAMAYTLMQRESHERLFSFENNWLRLLYGRMSTAFDKFGENQISFVTFNYDRTVEHFFHSALIRSYENVHPRDAKELIEEHIPIVHLHGRLGYLPWQHDDQARPYNDATTNGYLEVAAHNIKVIHENTGDRDADFTRAKKLIETAEKVVFLGFGYNQTNIERLGVQDLPPGKAIGSVYRLGGSAKNAALQATNAKIQFVAGDCTHIVNEELRWS